MTFRTYSFCFKLTVSNSLLLQKCLQSHRDHAISTLFWLECWLACRHCRKACRVWFFEYRWSFWSWRDSPICRPPYPTFSIRFGSPSEILKIEKKIKLTNPGLHGSPFLPGLSKMSFIIYSSLILLASFRKILSFESFLRLLLIQILEFLEGGSKQRSKLST